MHYLFLTSLLAALNLSPSVIATGSKPPPVIKSAWREYWKAEFPIANISWDKYNSISWAFVGLSSNCKITVDLSSSSDLATFVEEAHKNSVKALVSIGGANNSTNFSPCVAPNNSKSLVNTVMNFVKTHQLDGMEFDWEFPNTQAECNAFSSSDTDNFLDFVKQLRTAGPNMTITLAVNAATYVNSAGAPTTDMSPWAKVVDYITFMGYDIFGSWSDTVGPNSPLNDTGCAPQNVASVGSVATGIKTWMDAGFPADQIVMGVPSYGHGYTVAPSNALDSGEIVLYPNFTGVPFGSNDEPQGSPFYQTKDHCGNLNTQSGTYDFSGMIGLNYLTANGTNSTGIDYLFDPCSQTPYIYIPDAQIMISYDDAASFGSKGNFIKQQGLRGFGMWHVEGDYQNILVDAITSAMT